MGISTPPPCQRACSECPNTGCASPPLRAKDRAKLMLGKCDGSALQNWRFENYRLSLKAHPDKCLTIGPEPSRLTRGGRRLPSRHMARSLALATCSEEALERQLWRMEKPMDRTGSIMPFK